METIIMGRDDMYHFGTNYPNDLDMVFGVKKDGFDIIFKLSVTEFTEMYKGYMDLYRCYAGQKGIAADSNVVRLNVGDSTGVGHDKVSGTLEMFFVKDGIDYCVVTPLPGDVGEAVEALNSFIKNG